MSLFYLPGFYVGVYRIKPAAMGADMSFNQKGAMLAAPAGHNSIYSSSNAQVEHSFH